MIAFVVVALVSPMLAPRVRDAWITMRTGTAPDSRQAFQGAAATDGRLVMIGHVPSGSSAVAAAWELRAGTWHEIGDRRPDRLLFDVAVDGDRVVAVGSERGRPAIFERTLQQRERPWRVVFRSAASAGEFTAVVATEDGVIAAGASYADAGPSAVVASHARGATSWTQETLDGSSSLRAVAVAGESIVAAGQAGETAAVWVRSRSGGPWVQSDLPGGRRSFVSGLVARDLRVVAVGQADLAPATWLRDDDGTWGPAIALPGQGPGRRVVSVAHGGERFAAVGAAVGLGDVQRPLAWVSDDGSAWREAGAAGADEAGFVDVVAADGELVALGNGREGRRLDVERHVLRGSAFVIDAR